MLSRSFTVFIRSIQAIFPVIIRFSIFDKTCCYSFFARQTFELSWDFLITIFHSPLFVKHVCNKNSICKCKNWQYFPGAMELGAQLHTQILTIFLSIQEKFFFWNLTRFDRVRSISLRTQFQTASAAHAFLTFRSYFFAKY